MQVVWTVKWRTVYNIFVQHFLIIFSLNKEEELGCEGGLGGGSRCEGYRGTGPGLGV